jgi:hypothetical protein
MQQKPQLYNFDYAIIRVVPRVEREEFINVGAIVSCTNPQFLEARIELDRARLKALFPAIDADMIEHYLDTIPKICAGAKEAGAIGQMPPRSRFYWLTAPRSTIIQTSPVHTGLCSDAEKMLEHLMDKMVRINTSDED